MTSTGDPALTAELDFDFERRPLASQSIYGSLRRRIVDLRLRPGELVSRAQLASEYGVSQTPVRDAFFQLQREGLVEIFPQSRTVVAKINVAHARETQFLRMALEIEVGKTLAAAGDPSRTARARHVLQLQIRAFEEERLERFSALDRYFHLSLCEAAGHPALWHMISERSGHIDRLRALNLPDPGKVNAIVAAHGQILDAIEAGDAAACETAVRQHLSGTLSAVRVICERYPDYFDAAAG
ncbi:GntR family transcriptional regulator [Jiella avicenniae]|uniref:GntR family transcriptional regulator n=1 Tax=Jiella avicenniae TaxID=2907202 RepID=A0A9X1NXT9_9HYPH|nr:GntR family transcriptional regulator [Jiella avicenniae]MCE7027577.1 GntR family transcriptional regulator [Jiella avicenniae]